MLIITRSKDYKDNNYKLHIYKTNKNTKKIKSFFLEVPMIIITQKMKKKSKKK